MAKQGRLDRAFDFAFDNLKWLALWFFFLWFGHFFVSVIAG